MRRRDPIQVLQQLARRFGVRVKAAIRVDPRIRTRSLARFSNPPQSWYRYSALVKSGHRRLTLSANDRFIQIEAMDSRIAGAFSINHPDHIQGWRKTLPQVSTEELRVFVGRRVVDVPVLRQPPMVGAIRALKLQREEGLHVVPGRVLAFVTPTSSRRVLHVVHRLDAVIDQLTDRSAPTGDFRDLPGQFHRLIPLMRAWSIGDDLERSRKMSRTATERLERLISEVQPNFNAINRYLDQYQDGWPDSVAALAGVAEAASEAMLLVATREWRRQQRD